jgi:predicted AAA+ superfamily ATPase
MPVELFLDSYIATYLERDVRQVLNVGNLRDFERFMRACALRSGQLLNRSELARDIGVSVPTATSWISVLEALGQIHLLEPWFSSPTKRLVKSPKLYFTDAALMIRFCGLPADQLLFSPFIGAVWETLVYAELRKQLAFEGSRAGIWFYRDQSGLEVDFIIDEGSRRQLLECKWAGSPDLHMAEPALALRKQWQNPAAGVQAGASAAMSVGVISRSPEVFTASGVRFSPPAGRWFQPPNE